METYAAKDLLFSISVLLIRFKSIELNKCCISRKSSSPFNKLTSDEIRSSTKSSKVSERGFTTKNYFCHYHLINNKSQPNLNINF